MAQSTPEFAQNSNNFKERFFSEMPLARQVSPESSLAAQDVAKALRGIKTHLSKVTATPPNIEAGELIEACYQKVINACHTATASQVPVDLTSPKM
jgi:hypothetical protein